MPNSWIILLYKNAYLNKKQTSTLRFRIIVGQWKPSEWCLFVVCGIGKLYINIILPTYNLMYFKSSQTNHQQFTAPTPNNFWKHIFWNDTWRLSVQTNCCINAMNYELFNPQFFLTCAMYYCSWFVLKLMRVISAWDLNAVGFSGARPQQISFHFKQSIEGKQIKGNRQREINLLHCYKSAMRRGSWRCRPALHLDNILPWRWLWTSSYTNTQEDQTP